MSASCEWTLTLVGKDRKKHLAEILETLYRIEKINDAEEGARVFKVSEGKNYATNEPETRIFTSNAEAREIWGINYLNLDLQEAVFCTVAKAAPEAKWSATISCIDESGGGGCESYARASYTDGKLELKTENYVDCVTMADLVARMNTADNSFDAFCTAYIVDVSIDEETYEEYKEDEYEDDFYFCPSRNTVAKRHLWDIKTINI